MSITDDTSDVTVSHASSARRSSLRLTVRRIFMRPEAAAAAGFVALFVAFSLTSDLFFDKITFISITNIQFTSYRVYLITIYSNIMSISTTQSHSV